MCDLGRVTDPLRPSVPFSALPLHHASSRGAQRGAVAVRNPAGGRGLRAPLTPRGSAVSDLRLNKEAAAAPAPPRCLARCAPARERASEHARPSRARTHATRLHAALSASSLLQGLHFPARLAAAPANSEKEGRRASTHAGTHAGAPLAPPPEAPCGSAPGSAQGGGAGAEARGHRWRRGEEAAHPPPLRRSGPRQWGGRRGR